MYPMSIRTEPSLNLVLCENYSFDVTAISMPTRRSILVERVSLYCWHTNFPRLAQVERPNLPILEQHTMIFQTKTRRSSRMSL